MHTALKDEMREFPYGKHDDIVDTLAYIIQVMKPGTYSTVKRQYEYRPRVSRITNY